MSPHGTATATTITAAQQNLTFQFPKLHLVQAETALKGALENSYTAVQFWLKCLVRLLSLQKERHRVVSLREKRRK